MRKISIVGVEGSGKTVLLSAIGDKYENPDVSGVFMSPENARAFGFVKLHMEAMRNGQWPAATTTNSNLDWTLFKKTDSVKEIICQLSLLDFAGELYRLCFGEHSEDEIGNWAEEMEILKKHIAESDLLIVIVNLSDVINASPSNPRARETMWLTKSVIDYATRNGNDKDVAIVFSQADIYKSEIEACGGKEAALQKYLPHVANVYDNLPVFTVSAINKTVPDENTGIAIPARDFKSEGLDELMEWIISKTPGYADLAQSMTDTRLAPIHLWAKAQDLYTQYQNSQFESTATRYSIAKDLYETLQELRSANIKSPKNAQTSEEVNILEIKAQEFFDFESIANDIMSTVTCFDKDTALNKLEEYSRTSQQVEMDRPRLSQEIDSLFNILKKNHDTAIQRKKLKIALVLLSIVAITIAGWVGYTTHQQAVYDEQMRELARQKEEEEKKLARQKEEEEKKLARQHEQEMRQKEEQGYEIITENGKKRAVWTVGRVHPQNSNLIADSSEGNWICKKPGYKWTSGSNIEWQSGVTHPDNSNLKSGSTADQWICTIPGYVWTGGTNYEWRAGQTSDRYPHWVSVERIGYWKPQDGYRKKDSSAEGLSELVWNPGVLSNDKKRKAAQTEGNWLYKTSCGSCGGDGKVSTRSDCWTCNGSGKVESTTSCSSCDGTGRRSSSRNCYSCSGRGQVRNVVTCSNCNGTPRQICNPRLGLHDRAPEYTPAGLHAVRCMFCGGSGRVGVYPWVSVCNNCRGQGGWPCNNCGGDGWWECSRCNNGQVDIGTRQCSSCSGSGKRYSTTTCESCNGDRVVKKRRDCSYCSNGKRYGTTDCSRCRGYGYTWE
ncbi:MAG: hypothetical protein E7040_07945 [Lentisphaerae bacterium]|nr:hypothetical protein [Lentisphaerota bacterium]